MNPCRGWCVGCSCPSAALRVVSSSPAAQFALQPSSNAAKPLISSPSAGPSTATSCPTHRTPWSARCLDASRVLSYSCAASETDAHLHSTTLLRKTFHIRFVAVFEDQKACILQNGRLIFWTQGSKSIAFECCCRKQYDL